jgi:hypothetical protein
MCDCLKRLEAELRKAADFARDCANDGCGPERYAAVSDVHRAVVAAMSPQGCIFCGGVGCPRCRKA